MRMGRQDMITIPQTIKYDRDKHERDCITKLLDPKVTANLKFIRTVLTDLKKAGAESYIVRHKTGKVQVCRKDLKLRQLPDEHREHHNFYALKKNGTIITAGKNSRRIEALLGVLRSRARNNPHRLIMLSRADISVKEKCDRLGYELLKQDTPFD